MSHRIPPIVGEQIRRVYVPGLIDVEEDPDEILPFVIAVFLMTRSMKFVIRLDGQTNLMQMEVVNEFLFSFQFELEDNHTECLIDVGCLVFRSLRSGQGTHIRDAKCFIGCNADGLPCCGAIELTTQSNEVLFFHSLSFDGIQMGEADERTHWFASVPHWRTSDW